MTIMTCSPRLNLHYLYQILYLVMVFKSVLFLPTFDTKYRPSSTSDHCMHRAAGGSLRSIPHVFRHFNLIDLLVFNNREDLLFVFFLLATFFRVVARLIHLIIVAACLEMHVLPGFYWRFGQYIHVLLLRLLLWWGRLLILTRSEQIRDHQVSWSGVAFTLLFILTCALLRGLNLLLFHFLVWNWIL